MTAETAVIVLGHREDELFSREMQGRIKTGLDTYQRVDADYLLLAGGGTKPIRSVPESDLMAWYARAHGVRKTRIYRETDSRSTIENAYYLRRLIERESLLPRTVSVVTSDYHVERASYVFRQVFPDTYQFDFSRPDKTDRSFEQTYEPQALTEAREFFDRSDSATRKNSVTCGSD